MPLFEVEFGAVVAHGCRHRPAQFQQPGLFQLSTFADDWAAELPGEA
jgi:hypothetical protein